MSRTLRILIVDDSPTARQMLRAIIGRAPDMRVVAEAYDGQQGVALAQEIRPDVILMDLVMPKMNGLEATREIMHLVPTPIVVISASLESWETDIAFEAISAGALTVRRKPVGLLDTDHDLQANELLNVVRAMADVHVIHHWKRHHPRQDEAPPAEKPAAVAPVKMTGKPELVALVSSTGGPAALSQILRQLPAEFPLPVVIVQHIASDFVSSLRDWLRHVALLDVEIARQGQQPEPAHVYLAPGGTHLKLNGQQRFVLSEQPDNLRHIPSGDVLFESLAQNYGSRAVGVLLTGMGADGARGLKAMRDAGAYTIAQDEESSVVFGMPREAIAMGAAKQVLGLSNIPQVLLQISKVERPRE